MSKIKTTKVTQSKLSTLDFDNIPFGRVFSDHMFVADYIDGEWTNIEIVPFAPFEISPVNLALHYGQSIFEGMKATKMADGTPAFFRPEKHVDRINASAARMCMPEIPHDLFMNAIHELVALEKDWIPPAKGSALYIRPFMFATTEMLGVQVATEYKFMIVTGPVGPYYPKPVKLWAETEYIRASEGGVGEAKTSGNYAASLLPAKLAKERGCDQVLWLDGKEFKYIQEVGTMNIFFVINGKVITPSTTGAILKGITRDSFLHILREQGIEVEERLISIDEIVAAHKDGTLEEVFGSGTAAVVANVSDILYKDVHMKLPPVETHKIAAYLKATINGLRSGEIQDSFEWIVPVKATEKVVTR